MRQNTILRTVLASSYFRMLACFARRRTINDIVEREDCVVLCPCLLGNSAGIADAGIIKEANHKDEPGREGNKVN